MAPLDGIAYKKFKFEGIYARAVIFIGTKGKPPYIELFKSINRALSSVITSPSDSCAIVMADEVFYILY